MTKAARIGAPVSSPSALQRRQACHSPQTSSPSTSPASGRPSSAASCKGKLWVWSKNSVGRFGNGVSVQAKLNSP